MDLFLHEFICSRDTTWLQSGNLAQGQKQEQSQRQWEHWQHCQSSVASTAGVASTLHSYLLNPLIPQERQQAKDAKV